MVYGLVVIILLSAGLSLVSAQEAATPPTLPTKTPIAAPNGSETPSAEVVASPLVQSFTQADLTILTGNIQRPNGLAWYDGTLYVSCSGDWTVYAIDSASGTTTQYIYGVKNANTIYAAATSGERPSLWMPDFMSNALVVIENGVSRIVAADLAGPWGITRWSEDTFLVTNLKGNTLIAVQTDGQVQEWVNGFRSPTGVAVDGNYVYVANTGSARRAIEWIDASGLADGSIPVANAKEAAKPLVSGLQNTTNIVMAPDGMLYFSYALGTRGVVGRVDPVVCRENGGCTNAQVEVVLFSDMAAPLAGLTISPEMNLYVHTIFSPDLYSISLTAQPVIPN